MSYVRRSIQATISLGTGDFGDNTGNTATLVGLRMQANCVVWGQAAMGTTQLRVFGLPLDMMNRLTTIGVINQQIRGQNTLTIEAGEKGGQLATIFKGTIDQCWAEFAGQPDVVLNVSAFAGLNAALKPVPALSFKGSADVADVMKGIAAQNAWTFENNGVSVILANPNFPGTALEQVRQAAYAAQINYCLDRDILAIWPLKGFRTGNMPTISPTTGLVGYPTFTSNGVSLTTLFAPNARMGGQCVVNSQLTPANGTWNIISVIHNLECETPGGQWFTHLECARVAA